MFYVTSPHASGLNVLTREEVLHFRERLSQATWVNGLVTTGHQSAKAENNLQLHEQDPLAHELGTLVLQALGRNSPFFSTALPLRIYPPMFNCYREGQTFGYQVDNAIRYGHSRQGPPQAIRTDVSNVFVCRFYLPKQLNPTPVRFNHARSDRVTL